MSSALVKKESDDTRPPMTALRRLIADLRFAAENAEDALEKDVLETAINAYEKERISMCWRGLLVMVGCFFILFPGLCVWAYLSGALHFSEVGLRIFFAIFGAGMSPIGLYISWDKARDARLYGSMLPLLPEKSEDGEESNEISG